MSALEPIDGKALESWSDEQMAEHLRRLNQKQEDLRRDRRTNSAEAVHVERHLALVRWERLRRVHSSAPLRQAQGLRLSNKPQ